jgi:phosphoenolpyruvate synthase/pyruvate phosphate dikinase
MKEQVQEVLPFLHETYMRIGRFQKNRSPRNEKLLRNAIDELGPKLQKFKSAIQLPKQAYFDAILRDDLSISDRIIALDTAVGAMHIEFLVPRAYSHQESHELKTALEQCRLTDDSLSQVNELADDDRIICRGIPASPGIVWGKAFLWSEDTPDYAIPHQCVLVAQMTRPELVSCIDKIAGIVTDNGGRLCHAAIIALERNVPCVVGTGNATTRLAEGMTVCVDGYTGLIRKE